MSNVIRFLEALGSRPAPSTADYSAIVAGLDLGAAERKALLDQDAVALNELLEGRTKMFCFIVAPDGDEQESVPDDADGDGVPDQEEPTREQ